MAPTQILAFASIILAAQAEASCAIARPGAPALRGIIRRIDWSAREVHISGAVEMWVSLDELADQISGGSAFILDDIGRPLHVAMA